ncbi:MAG: hypothetical protein OIF51_16035 [Cellvibrionaceae bacterium]|nr:hypothetical protein [Cellvibrionaceae bacterium]
MYIEAPTLGIAEEASEDLIAEILAKLPYREDPFLILSNGDLTFMQTLWVESGFVLEYQEGSIDSHYVTVSEQDEKSVREALISYLHGSDEWMSRMEFERMKMRGRVWSIGHMAGKFLGRITRFLRGS